GDRRAPREAGDLDHARDGLSDGVVRGAAVRERPPLAEAGDGDVHEARVDPREMSVPDSPPVERPRPELLDHDVGPGRELAEERLTLRLVEVDRDVVLGVVLREESERRVLPERAARGDVSHGVAAGRELDLDDLGAELAQEVGGRRTQDERGQLEDADTLERLRLVEEALAPEELRGPFEVGLLLGHGDLSSPGRTPAGSRVAARS